jgi:hypothetical protein
MQTGTHIIQTVCTYMPHTARASSPAAQQSMARVARRPTGWPHWPLSGRGPGATSIFSVTLSDARVRGERSPSRLMGLGSGLVLGFHSHIAGLSVAGVRGM